MPLGVKGFPKSRRTNKEQLFSSPIHFLDKKLKPSFQQKKKYAEAKLLEVLERAPIEKVNDFQEISGAPIYIFQSEQENVKKTSTLNTFTKLSGIDDIEQNFDEFICAKSLLLGIKWNTAFLVLNIVWNLIRKRMMLFT